MSARIKLSMLISADSESKVEDEPSNPKHIITVWGLGYKWIQANNFAKQPAIKFIKSKVGGRQHF